MRLPWNKGATLGAAAIALLLAMPSLAPAYAYFTDQSNATGGLVLGSPSTDIKEYYGDKVKHVVIYNKEKSTPVFVRARVYAYEEYLDSVAGVEKENSAWSGLQPDGWYYYHGVLDPGDETEELLVTIKFPTGKEIVKPDGSVDYEEYDQIGANFNVIVVYEAVPVQYGPDGELLAPENADWKLNPNQNGGE